MTFLLQMAGEAGTGKSTLARAVGKSTGALVIDKDDITGPLIDKVLFVLVKAGLDTPWFFG